MEEREQELAMNAQPEIALVKTQIDILTRQLPETKNRAAKAKGDEERERLTAEAVKLAIQLTALNVPLASGYLLMMRPSRP